MDIGEVRVADDGDFEKLKELLNSNDGWKQEYSKLPTIVHTKITPETNFKMIKLKTIFKNVTPPLLFDVLLDPDYRKIWDTYVLESYDIGCLNPNNDIGYYAVRCPSPLKNRDFVLQRSWLDRGTEYLIINHSVYHESVPLKKGYVRAVSYLTGFVCYPSGQNDSELNYITQSDPKGSLPPWVVNKLTNMFVPKMIKKLYKACLGYEKWKKKHNPKLKPWLYPEQMTLPKIDIEKCIKNDLLGSNESIDESSLEFKSDGFFDEDE